MIRRSDRASGTVGSGWWKPVKADPDDVLNKPLPLPHKILFPHAAGSVIASAMRLFLFALALLAFTPLSAVLAESTETNHPEARPFDESANAVEQVDAALGRAQLAGTRVIVVMGANWCHDSRGLSGWFAEPRFAAMLAAKYELVYVDVGMKDRNIDIAQRFGIKSIKGTPTVLILSADGKLLNRRSAPEWRDATSREEEDIFAYFDQFTPEL